MRWTTGSVITQLAVGGSLTLFVAGCGRSPEFPSDPATAAPVLPTKYTISGVVTEAGRPIASAIVGAWVDIERVSGGGFGRVETDDRGRYRLPGLVAGARVRLLVSKDGYVQQCAAAPLVVQGDTAIDLQLVARANLTASVDEPSSGLRTVSGTIVEVTSSGKQPVAGAYVAFHEATEDWDGLYPCTARAEGHRDGAPVTHTGSVSGRQTRSVLAAARTRTHPFGQREETT